MYPILIEMPPPTPGPTVTLPEMPCQPGSYSSEIRFVRPNRPCSWLPKTEKPPPTLPIGTSPSTSRETAPPAKLSAVIGRSSSGTPRSPKYFAMNAPMLIPVPAEASAPKPIDIEEYAM